MVAFNTQRSVEKGKHSECSLAGIFLDDSHAQWGCRGWWLPDHPAVPQRWLAIEFLLSASISATLQRERVWRLITHNFVLHDKKLVSSSSQLRDDIKDRGEKMLGRAGAGAERGEFDEVLLRFNHKLSSPLFSTFCPIQTSPLCISEWTVHIQCDYKACMMQKEHHPCLVSISLACNKCKKKFFFVLRSYKSAKYVFKGVVRPASTREMAKLNYFCNIERHNKHLFPHKNDSNFQSHFDLTVHLPESGTLLALGAHFSPFKASGMLLTKILKAIILHYDVMNVPSRCVRSAIVFWWCATLSAARAHTTPRKCFASPKKLFAFRGYVTLFSTPTCFSRFPFRLFSLRFHFFAASRLIFRPRQSIFLPFGLRDTRQCTAPSELSTSATARNATS